MGTKQFLELWRCSVSMRRERGKGERGGGGRKRKFGIALGSVWFATARFVCGARMPRLVLWVVSGRRVLYFCVEQEGEGNPTDGLVLQF
jgi:hypothetical protein